MIIDIRHTPTPFTVGMKVTEPPSPPLQGVSGRVSELGAGRDGYCQGGGGGGGGKLIPGC